MVDYEFYTDAYLIGKEAVIDAASFPFYERFASKELMCFAGQNIGNNDIPECVKLCVCEIAEALYTADKYDKQSGGKVSESVQGWSVSYQSAEQNENTKRQKIVSIIYKWLSGTGLLYRGVDIC